MRLNLPRFSRDEKQIISADLLNNTQKFQILNGVDLSTQEGKDRFIQAIIRGENPFKSASESQEATTEIDNNTTWSNLVSEANLDNRTITSPNPDKPVDEPIIRFALRKKTKELAADLGLGEDEIYSKILLDCATSVPKQCSIIQAVNFIRNYSDAPFLECDHCGATNRPAWTICRGCGEINPN